MISYWYGSGISVMVEIDTLIRTCSLRRVGTGPEHHFFGYYNKNIWDRTGRYLLSNRVNMMTGDLTGMQVAEIGFFDLENGDQFHSLGRTTAWNWQMGCQLQWLEGKPDRQIIYNSRWQGPTRVDAVYPDFCSIVCNAETGDERTLPLPVYVVAPNSHYALCVDYSRFQVTHRTIGYSATQSEPDLENAPAKDGIHMMDIATGESELVLSLRDLSQFHPLDSMNKAIHWVTHLEINPASSRVLFIHRWTERVEDETCFLHRLITMTPEGSDLKLLECTDHPLPQLQDDFDPSAVATFEYEKSEYQISHPTWRDDDHVMVWGPHKGSISYQLYDDVSGQAVAVGGSTLLENGHMTYSPNREWILTDTYPDDVTNVRSLILYNVETDQRYDIGQFLCSPHLGKENRCDLHPRWSPDGKKVCIDSVHESERQIYIVDVTQVVGLMQPAVPVGAPRLSSNLVSPRAR